MVNVQLQKRAEAVPKGRFLGGPRRDFEKVGRTTFELLLREGLRPDHKVVDVGCGALRVGYWLIHYLEAGGYFGIEPKKRMLGTGRKMILEPGVEDEKGPAFSRTTEFDFAEFDTAIDFVVARSVWTHASKSQIALMLDNFQEVASPGAKLLASFLPARPFGAKTGTGRRALWLRDYKGDEWVGNTRGQKKAGLVAHNTRWLKGACSERGLTADVIQGEVINRQRWLRVVAPRGPA